MEKLTQLIEGATRANQHIEFVSRLIEKNYLSEEACDALTAQMNEVRSRLADPHLYVAVIGEASSGKSTFINALLGDTLLEMGNITATTAAATVIQHGSAISTSIRFQSGNSEAKRTGPRNRLEFLAESVDKRSSQVLTFTEADEPITVSGIRGLKKLTVRELIMKVTTEPKITQKIASVNITLPAPFLEEGICIIDTPGTNVDIEDHQQVTQRAVNFADGVIILTTARSPMPSSLVKMVREELDLGEQILRSVFLITKMDWIDEEEHIRIVDHVKVQIKRNFSLDGNLPQVFFAVPKIVVQANSGSGNSSLDTQKWLEQFEKLKVELFEFLMRQRATVISEKVLHLLDDLFYMSDSYLAEMWKQFEANRLRLEAAVIPDINQFTLKQKILSEGIVRPAIDGGVIMVQLASDQFRSEVLAKAEREIMKKSSLDEIKTYLNSGLPSLLKRELKELQSQVDTQINDISEAAQVANTQFERNFRDAYKRLQTLKGSILNDNQSSEKLSLNQISFSSLNESNAFKGPSTGATLTTTAIGAVIGTWFFPVIGTAIGAFVGSLFGDIFGPSLDDRKKSLWNELRRDLVAKLSEIKTLALSEVSAYGNNVIVQLEGRIEEHKTYYGRKVSQLRQEQDNQAKAINQLQLQLDQAKYEISRRQQLVKNQLKKLATITF